jgi:hypothetical protein
MKFKSLLLVLILGWCLSQFGLLQAAWKTPYAGPKCPPKPNFLLIDEARWCEIHKAAHNAVTHEGLSDTLGYEKAMATMLGLIHKESSFRSDVIGRAGEVGLAQIMPSTGRFICRKTDKELLDIETNLNCSAKYLTMLLSKDYFDNDLNMSLIAYNQGWSNVKKGLYYEEDIRYARLILQEYSPRFKKMASL